MVYPIPLDQCYYVLSTYMDMKFARSIAEFFYGGAMVLQDNIGKIILYCSIINLSIALCNFQYQLVNYICCKYNTGFDNIFLYYFFVAIQYRAPDCVPMEPKSEVMVTRPEKYIGKDKSIGIICKHRRDMDALCIAGRI